MEHVTGKTSNISKYCDFDLYDLVWYHTGIHPNFNDENRSLGRWSGVSHRIGIDMCYWVLTKSGKVISETTVQNVTRYDMLDADTAAQVEIFNTAINQRLDETHFWIQHGEGGFNLEDEYDLQKWDTSYGDNKYAAEEYGAANGDMPLAKAEDLNHDDDQYDKCIGAKLIIDKKSNNGGNLATVIRRSTDEYGAQIGQAHRNTMLDTREFEVEL